MTKRELSQFNEIAHMAYLAQTRRKRYEEEERSYLKKLKELCHNKTGVGDKYIYLLSMRKGSVDYAIIPELKSVDLDQYRHDDVAMWKLGKL